jgi:pyrroloquinoline quinone (PQQ) biosynthesis protein C
MTLAATQADLCPTAAVRRNLWTAFQGIATTSGEPEWDALLEHAAWTAEQAFSADAPTELREHAELQVHQTLYRIYAGRVAVPWSEGWTDLDHFRFDQLRHVLESAWTRAESGRFADAFGPLPVIEQFPAWAQEKCQQDRSNVSHPLFAFLRDQASFEQLREFIVQETPFDIHFGDILAMMMPGVYGQAKMEFSKNFWDEMGRGELPSMHRQLRQQMTQQMDVADDMYFTSVERFRVEELRLANMYFHAVFNRALLPQAIGMMLATELMVPGRLDQQIEGWRRVGVKDDAMRYLLEHTVVDVEHANGWMHEVVLPMLRRQPGLIGEVVTGMARRLAYAAEVCDAMMDLLPTLEQRAAYA